MVNHAQFDKKKDAAIAVKLDNIRMARELPADSIVHHIPVTILKPHFARTFWDREYFWRSYILLCKLPATSRVLTLADHVRYTAKASYPENS